MHRRILLGGLALVFCVQWLGCGSSGGALYEYQAIEPRWASFENPLGGKGQGGRENRGAKGHAFDQLPAGETVVLADVQGSGTIRRIWLTISGYSPVMLRSLRLEMFWDGSAKPAVSVPLGDFFGHIHGKRAVFENEFFSNPNGGTFNCIVPMPFHKAARIALTNESNVRLAHLFYDIDYTIGDRHGDQTLYFHAYWHRLQRTTLGEDFEILPRVRGRGRFLGSHIGVIVNTDYEAWWGEGEVKVYLDGDDRWPTLVGTGLEDYLGNSWGLVKFDHRYQGCHVNESPCVGFYRYHVPDPIFFRSDCRVTVQQIGGTHTDQVRKMVSEGKKLTPISVDCGGGGQFVSLFEKGQAADLNDPDFPKGHTNFYRRDDYCATALFYLDRPASDLPDLQPLSERTIGLPEK
ncbi:MAG: DUF2961 domain-containing protein [Phycisphaerae bacterium]|nr:DUF2961 domain-containing protein [Phycisphaerae bacterium]